MNKVDHGDLSEKPGWVRMSIHPTMTNKELQYIIDAIKEIIENIDEWEKDYEYVLNKNEFFHVSNDGKDAEKVKGWFKLNDSKKIQI